MKIAIIGGTGLLGSNLIKLYENKGFDVKSFSRSSNSNLDCSSNFLINFDDLYQQLCVYFDEFKPDIVINAIALVDLEACENNPDYAHIVNAKIAQEVAYVSKKYNSYYIHVSTDHYYEDENLLHTESDDLSLLNEYAKSKFEGEKLVSEAYPDALIARTNIIGFRKSERPSFFEWLLSSLDKKENVNLFTDFYTSSICVSLLGEIFIKCYGNKVTGTYNIASGDVMDKYSFGLLVAQKFGLSDQCIFKSSLKDLKDTNVRRASSLGLNVKKIEAALNTKMPSIDKTIEVLLKEYKEGLKYVD